jgi:hypothetical protein
MGGRSELDPRRRSRGGEYWIWYWAVRVRRSSEVMDTKTIPSWTLGDVSINLRSVRDELTERYNQNVVL